MVSTDTDVAFTPLADKAIPSLNHLPLVNSPAKNIAMGINLTKEQSYFKLNPILFLSKSTEITFAFTC